MKGKRDMRATFEATLRALRDAAAEQLSRPEPSTRSHPG
jgi:hypothetical protein